LDAEPEREQNTAAFYRQVNWISCWRGVGFFLFLMVFIAALLLSFQPESEEKIKGCLGIPILSETDMEQFQTYVYKDYSDNLKYQNEFAAVDEENSVIYISHHIHENATINDLSGALTIDYPGQNLYFAPDENWDNFSDAVKQGHKFKLLVSGRKTTYMQYDVVFTALPVMSLYGKLLYRDQERVDTFSGQVVVWDPNEQTPVTSHGQWHIRGGSSKLVPKEPWKLSLKNQDNRNNSEELLGLGADDDWILNPMNMEDSNIREKLFMDLWNQMAMETSYNYPMSDGEYIELLINGEYRGLYLLQRRVDEKYLNLDMDSILMKVNRYGTDTSYEFRYIPFYNGIPYDVLDAFFYGSDSKYLNKRNFVDVCLFLEFFSAVDNADYKNMFYVFDKTDSGYSISMIPWDTDMSMGSTWKNEIGFAYDYQKSVTSYVGRQEYQSMHTLYSDLDQDFSDRWFELRKSIFALEHIWNLMDAHLEVLESSGAVARDQEKWGLFFEGEDTIENLYRFVEDRLAVLDEFYSQ